MSGNLQGQVAIVTGAGAGIGRATAALFHKEGARVGIAKSTPVQVGSRLLRRP